MNKSKGHYGEDFGHDGMIKFLMQEAKSWMADMVYKNARRKGPGLNNYYGYDSGTARCPYKVEPKKKPEIAF